MKFLLTFSLSVFAFSAFAQGDLSSMKRDASSHIDKKISTLESSKSCISNANSLETFKACKYDMHQEMKMQKEEAREHDHMKQNQESTGFGAGAGASSKAPGSKLIESKESIKTETFTEEE